MDAAAEIGRNLELIKHQMSMEKSRLTRDGTAEPVLRDQILRRKREGKYSFSLFSWPRAGLATLPG